jgi:hypothetical protein
MNDAGTDTHELGAAIRAAAQTVHAPEALRGRIEAQRAPKVRRRQPVRRPLLGFAGAGLAAAVVAIVLAAGGSSAPTFSQAASAALSPPAGPAPAEDAHHRGLLKASVDRVRFPQWEYAFRWYPTGTRHDTLGDGRRATTVYYDRGALRIGYTIVSGAALPVPQDARTVRRNGVDYNVLRRGGATLVTWRRAGHTCVLAASGVPVARMVALAAWDGAGTNA